MPAYSLSKSYWFLFVCIVLISTFDIWASESNIEQASTSQAKISFLPPRPEVDSTEARPQQLLNVAKAFDSSSQFMVASRPGNTQKQEIRQASFNESDSSSISEEENVRLDKTSEKTTEKIPVLELPPKQIAASSKENIDTELKSNETDVSESRAIAEESKNKGDALLDQALVFSKNKSGKDRLEQPRLTGAVAPIVSVVGSLLIVLATFLFLAILFKKLSPKSGRLLPKEAFEDLGRAFLGQKMNLHLLRLGNRLILVCVTPDGVSPVTEVTDPDEVVPLLGMCRRLDENSSSELFKQTLSKIIDKESKDDGYFGTETNSRNKKANKTLKSNNASALDLYSDSNESLTDLLASGLTAKGAKHG